MKLRVIYNVVMVRLGMRQVLPADFVNAVAVEECNEPLVALPANAGLVVTGGETFCGRASMVSRLMRAAAELSGMGYRLKIYQTYRSPVEQARRREELRRQLREKFPGDDDEQLLRKLNRGIAGVGGGHQTGGAVDVGLCDREGRELDMGTRYMEHGPNTMTRSKALTAMQRRHRQILTRAMRRAGFVNYPAEWWHFSFGDKMWAAYGGKKRAIYGICDRTGH